MIVGRHALVTGGGSGLGMAVALALADGGVNVTICGRDPGRLATVDHPKVHGLVADVTDEASIMRLYETASLAHGPFDIVVANAGGSSSASASRISLSDWQSTLAVNLTGAFLTVKPALGPMIEAKGGRIVFVASTAGLRGYPYVAPYVAAKHGVIGLMRALATELAKTGVTINAVCPGFAETDLLAQSIDRIVARTGRSEAETRATLANPQGRFVTPEEVAATVLWLVSEAAQSVTGQAISVSGGETW